MCGRATQPEPSTPNPHATAVIRTTLGACRAARRPTAARARRAASSAAPARRSAGTGRRGPARAAPCAAARASFETVEDLRLLHLRAQLRLTGDQQQRSACDPDEREAERGPGKQAAERVEQPQRRDHRQPAARHRAGEAATHCSSEAPTSAPTSPASGVYGEPAPPCSRCGATRAPISAPATSPPNDSAVATSPRRSPVQRTEHRDRGRDPVDARHANHFGCDAPLPCRRYTAARTGA